MARQTHSLSSLHNLWTTPFTQWVPHSKVLVILIFFNMACPNLVFQKPKSKFLHARSTKWKFPQNFKPQYRPLSQPKPKTIKANIPETRKDKNKLSWINRLSPNLRNLLIRTLKFVWIWMLISWLSKFLKKLRCKKPKIWFIRKSSESKNTQLIIIHFTCNFCTNYSTINYPHLFPGTASTPFLPTTPHPHILAGHLYRKTGPADCILGVQQTSANNLTPPSYSKNIRYSAIIQGRIVGRIVAQYWEE